MQLTSGDNAVDLTTCDREPIHVPGHVQPHGALLVFDLPGEILVHASDNVARFVGASPPELFGEPLANLLRASLLPTKIRGAIAAGKLTHRAEHVGAWASAAGTVDVLAHVRGSSLLVELELAPTTPDGPVSLSLLTRALGDLPQERSLRSFCQRLAEQVASLSGYDRVMIYRFDEDDHGWVFAEHRREDLESFLDLHYPASDIPRQARELFYRNGVRMVPDVDYVPSAVVPLLHPTRGVPVDMTYAELRGASVMYTEYLKNMGVAATLTLALTRGPRLWGLIACHHTCPRAVSWEVRSGCELLARVASAHLDTLDHADHAGAQARAERVIATLVARSATSPRAETLCGEFPNLGDVFPGSSAALVIDGSVTTVGEAPPDAVIVDSLRWLVAEGTSARATTMLGRYVPSAAAAADRAAGLLGFASPGGKSGVLWFFPEQRRAVSWAGDPRKPVSVGPFGERLTPRASFALWREEVAGRSQSIEAYAVEIASRFREPMTSLLFGERSQLKERTHALEQSLGDLDAFAYAAAHDLKEPLRGIENNASFLAEDIGSQLAPADAAKLEAIMRLAQRMRMLVDGLLEFSRTSTREMAIATVNLDPLLDDVLADLGHEITSKKATVHRHPLPAVRGAPAAFGEIFANLVGNALKYAPPGASPIIEIGARRPDDAGYSTRSGDRRTRIFVRDHGIGMDPRHHEVVFQLFRRLHGPRDYGGGTGLGLAIVRRLVERLGGDVWLEQADPGLIAWFTVEEAA